MKKNKYIIIGIIIGILAFPTASLGGTFISSLIQGKTVDEAVQILATQLNSLIGRVEVLEEGQERLEGQQNKDQACRKMQELKKAPQETKVAYYTESSGAPIYASWAPDNTDALLKYLNAFMENYRKTGSAAYTHIPDYRPDIAQQYIPILEARWQEYLIQQAVCEQD